jgi:ferredoxin-NADP reductase
LEIIWWECRLTAPLRDNAVIFGMLRKSSERFRRYIKFSKENNMDHEHYRNMHGHGMPSMKKASFEVALKGKRQIAEGTYAFVFEKPAGFPFKAGQHIRMTLINPLETDSEGDSRFFSPSSSPQESDLVVAMRMRDTAFKRVMGRMRIGEKVLIQILLGVPHGAFALHEDASKSAVFLVGGIGIVPAFSMIKDAIERKLPHRIILFYSNRRPEDAPFLDELEQLAKQNPTFTLVATMTEPKKSLKPWRGETGRISKAMLVQYVGDLQSPIYYMAGLPEMTSAMKALLADAGVREDNMRAEEFTGFNLNELRSALNHSWRRHALPLAIVLIIIVMIAAHGAAAIAVYHFGLGTFSFQKPILYLAVGLLAVLVVFKLKHLRARVRQEK